jgi:hypothetical protein
VLEERGSDLVLMGVAKSSVSSLQNNPRPAKRSKNAPLFVPPPQYEEEAATAVVANGKKSLSFASDAAKMSACKEVVKLLAVSKLSEGEVIARVQWRQDVLEPVLQEVTQKDRDGKLLLKDDAAVWDLLDPKELPTEHRASALRTLSRLGLRSEKMEAALVRYAEMRKELQEARAAVAKVYAALKKSPTESPEKALQVVARLQHRVKAVARDGQKLMEEIDALGGQTRKSNKK